jgi:hypothetical protein
MRALRPWCLLGLFAIWIVGIPPVAIAHDNLAPRGAPHRWLPHEPWVMQHRIPFDEARLQAALGLRGRQLESYTLDDHHRLADLARWRGLDPDALADELVAPWRSQVGDDELAVLRKRTMRLLTQGHLAQHVFSTCSTISACNLWRAGCLVSQHID